MSSPSSGTPLLTVEHVGKSFRNGTVALAGVDLAVARGAFLSILGPSGCGKSTLLRIIAGLTPPSQGQILSGDGDLSRSIGFVFQEPTLMPWATVWDNVYLPLRLAGRAAADVAGDIDAMLAAVGLDGFARVYPRELSGGMRMRVSIARALVTAPRLLLLDEPFAALDEITRFKLNEDLLRLWRRIDCTVIFVTHSVFESVFLSSRIVVMAPRPGRIAADVAVDLPYPREAGLRVLPDYIAACADVSQRFGEGDGMSPRLQDRLGRIAAPLALGVFMLLGWEAVVRWNGIPSYILPGPLLVAETLWTDGPSLLGSLWVTVRITAEALAAAIVFGGALSVLFAQSRLLERCLFPYAVILQVTPIVSIAPLIIIWVNDTFLTLLICAWIVAFFPIVANTTLGLNSADRNLVALFRLYGASRWQVLRHLRLPSALPYFLAGTRISGGLALVGAVVAEFVAGTGGAETGLASRILEAGYRLQIPRLFAALLLLSLTGIAIFALLSWLTHRLLAHWHESVLPQEE